MPKRASRKPRTREVDQIAAEISEILLAATGGAAPLTIEGTRNPAGTPRRSRLVKGGKARAKSRRPAKRTKKTKKGVAARRKAK